MLEWKSQEKAITQEEEGACKREIKAIQKELAALQQPIKQAGLPVLLVFEGWSASGKGSIISKVISELDPRGYQVWSYADPTDEEGRRPLLWPFWRDLPPRGEMAVLDRSWYSRALTRLEEDQAAASGLVESINTFERQLGDDGYLILKFFLNISRREQKRRLEKLSDHGATAWRVTDRDWRRNREYAARAEVTELLLQATNPVHAPWHVVQNEDKTRGTLEVLRRVRDALRAALEDGAPRPLPPEQVPWPLRAMPRLKDVDLSPSTTEEAYRAELKRERKKLQKLHSRLYREKVPVVLGFEGWDASGKGGGRSAGSPGRWTPGALMWCPSPRPPRKSSPDPICGVSGGSFPRTAMWSSSTVPGMAGSWWRGWRASPLRRGGAWPMTRSTSLSGS